MFRTAPRMMMRAGLVLRQAQTLPTGFSYVADNKVEDLDPTKTFEQKETLSLTLTRQDEFLFKIHEVKSVSFSTISGEIGVFSGHEYKISKLVPGPIRIEHKDGSKESYFASGGFAHINNEGSCDVNCVEVVPLAVLDLANAEAELANANAAVGNAKDDKGKALAGIRVELAEACVAYIKTESGSQ